MALLSGSSPHAIALLLMGVSGCGKSTVGSLLAASLRWEFRDADDFHPPANVAKMAAGTPLTDEDRMPWLEAIRSFMQTRTSEGKSVVVTCSALKESYRQLLQFDPNRVKLVYLHGDYALIRERMRSRQGHFMKETMLKSQFATLEPPKDALTVEVAHPPEQIVATIVQELGLR